MAEELEGRRPIKTRDSGWAKAIARALSRTAVTPNAISVLSVVCAAAAGACFFLSEGSAGAARVALLVGAAVAVQARLICNLLDGMVAIEGGKASKTGGIFNDLPDRFADLLILAPAGYGLLGWPWARELGWLAGTLAVLTAYVRMLAASLGLPQDFRGVMSKPKRMAVMTAAALLSIGEPLLHERGGVVYAALLVVAVGSAVTVVGRTVRMARLLESR
ncbi:hypothetical protein [Terriglobus sp.]|uniref:hypothetical protein n=1 Tax=Terriglobus sp. TaxID=1889013 RepID=UPI003B00FAF6